MHMEFDNITLKITNPIKRVLQFIPEHIKNACQEIRLRCGLPICLTVDGSVLFVCQDSTVCNTLPKNPVIASKDDVNETLSLLCDRSVYLHENEIKQGFISLSDGCRAGVCGIFNTDGMLISVSSVNIRIARQVFGCADGLLKCVGKGLLIVGPPGSGKTTILRDLVRQLSNGANGQHCRISVVDSRGEISGGGRLELGVCTDVLSFCDKSNGIEMALRTMFPDFIAFDEIGNYAEFEGVKNCFNAGVGIITTAHCNGVSDMLSRDIIGKIIESGAIENIALLSEKHTQLPQIMSCKELKNVCS